MENLSRVQLKLKATPEQLFHALTDSTALTAWFCEYANVSFTDQAYDFWGRFTPEAPANQQAGHHLLTLLRENRHVAYQWQLFDIESHVLFKILRQEDDTLLTLRHAAPDGTVFAQGWELRDFWFLHLENLRAYLAGKPAAARVDFTKPKLGDIRHELLIDASPSTVFEVIIRPDQIDRWIGNGSTVDPTAGGSYTFGWMRMKILEIVPDEKLSVSPTYENNGVEEATPHAFTWTLTESNGKTRLTFVHSGFAPDESTESAYLGWLSYINRLKSVAEFGDEWEHPLVIMEPDKVFMYPIDIAEKQGDFLDELIDDDPLLSPFG